MRYAIIEGGVVANVALAEDPAFPEEQGWIACPDEVGPGWTFDGQEFAAPAPNPIPPSPALIDAERDRRIDAGIEFGGVRFQTREKDRENIMGAFSLAAAWIMTGGNPTSLRWHGGESDFEWIAEDNSTVAMSAATVLAFGKAVAAMKSRMIFVARALKDTLPADFADEGYWS